MRTLALIALSGAAAAAAAVPPPPKPSPTPPFMPSPSPVIDASGPPEPAIVRFRAGPARCAGDEQRAILTEEPFPTGVLRLPPPGRTVALRFRIDAAGRPLGIAHERSPIPGYNVTDVPAAFAAWRFAAGAERRDCTIVFTPVAEPVATARQETLYRFLSLHPVSGQFRIEELGRAAFERVKPAGSTCFDPRPAPRLLAFPAFEAIEQPPGTAHFSTLGFDIAADGRVRNARLLGSSGHADLDRRSLGAVARSRFQPGARTGCIQDFYRIAPDDMPAPPIPDEEAFRPEGATCAEDEPGWTQMPRLEFPRAFNRRAIEGWAILSYDLSPWGQTGNVRVLASEPAWAFGEEAARIVQQARVAPAETGQTGCTTRVIFILPPGRGDPPRGD